MQVSHEAIYRSLYVQGRGELRRDLAKCLRNRPGGRAALADVASRSNRIPNLLMISERPAEADDRAVPGHSEGDLIIGANSRSAIGTLVERSTRFLDAAALAGQTTRAETVRDAVHRRAMSDLPAALRRSLTG